ncbi:MAG: DMT family transporter [Phycisphaerae bacterium]|nr:DMT family transporter [Phycisphaerae bacterium]MDW8262159.1 DMT family transporter [Phycisphaerales bacterium]
MNPPVQPRQDGATIPTVIPVGPSSHRGVGIALLLGCASLWSLNGLLVKLTAADPLAFAGLRSAIAAGFVLLLLPISGFGRLAAGPMAASVLSHTLMVGFFIAAITLGRAASGVILQYTGPAWVALIAWKLQGERIGGRTVAAVVLTLTGVVVMLLVPLWREATFDPVGPLCGLLAGIAFGCLVVMLEKVDRDSGGANALAIIFINNAGTALLLVPLALVLDRLHLSTGQWGLITVCGIVQHALPYLLFQFGLRRVRPVEASLLILLEPLLSPTWVAIFIGEYPSRWDILGGIAIFGALLLEATKKNPPSPANLAVD